MASGKITHKNIISGNISSGNNLKSATVTSGSGTTDHNRLINKEAAEIRNESKDLNNPHKARNLLKAIYMQMMGYQTSFMQLLCINLLASKNFTEKRIAYSALSLVMDENSKVLLLATAPPKTKKSPPELMIL